jgi:hypothetical protein
MQESESRQPRYDVCKEGSLTYFRYYLEDESTSINKPSGLRFKLFTIALISSGFALISFAAGVAIAKIGNSPENPIIETR